MDKPGIAARSLAEGIGTFGLVFFGAGSIVANHAYDGVIGHMGIALIFGAIVLAMVYAFGEMSGAHINPAVTLSFWAAGKFPAREVPFYVLAQSAGAILAALAIKLFFPEHPNLGATIPTVSPVSAIIMEALLTYFLMLVIIQVSTGSKEVGLLAGVAIGTVVMLEAAFAGPITGASMNPARSLGPALVSGHWNYLWVYLIGPISGGVLSIATWKIWNSNNKNSKT